MEVPRTNCEPDCAEENIKDAANIPHDRLMLAKLGNIGFHSTEAKYHNICKGDDLNRARSAVTEQIKSEVKVRERNVQEMALGLVVSYIQSSVIDNNRPKYLVSHHGQYCQFEETLSQKIFKTFGYKVIVESKVWSCIIAT